VYCDLDLKRLSRGEQLLSIAAILLFLSSFVGPWGNVEVSTSAEGADIPPALQEQFETRQDLRSFNLWDRYGVIPRLGALISLVLVALIVVKAAGGLDGVNLPAPLGLVYLAGGGIVFLTMLVAFVFGPEGSNEISFVRDGSEFTIEQQRGVLLYLGILLSAAMAAGGFLHMQEEGSTPAEIRRPAGPPPPPPPAR
jgi:hypothetical protein